MSQRGKLVEKIRARPVEADYDDVEVLMRYFGWVRDRESGSHVVFTKPGRPSFSVPKKGGKKVAGVYLDKICDLLGLDDLDLNDL